MAVWGVLKPILTEKKAFWLETLRGEKIEQAEKDGVCDQNTNEQTNAPSLPTFKSVAEVACKLTKSNFFVESNAAGALFGHNFLGGEEHAVLLLEGFFSLEISHLWKCFQ